MVLDRKMLEKICDFYNDFASPLPGFVSGSVSWNASGSGRPKWKGSKRILIRKTALDGRYRSRRTDSYGYLKMRIIRGKVERESNLKGEGWKGRMEGVKGSEIHIRGKWCWKRRMKGLKGSEIHIRGKWCWKSRMEGVKGSKIHEKKRMTMISWDIAIRGVYTVEGGEKVGERGR